MELPEGRVILMITLGGGNHSIEIEVMEENRGFIERWR